MNSLLTVVDVKDIVPYVSSKGHKFVQIFQAIPILEPFYMEWEKNYDAASLADWISSNHTLPIITVIAYLVLIFGGQHLMKNKEPYDLRKPLAYWNLFLCIFSFIGSLRVIPHFLFLTHAYGMHEVVCGAPEKLYGSGSAGFWVAAFILSKYFELIDTAFIVLRKRPLLFLHWYHHLTVLLFCWFQYSFRNPGIIFVTMNYTVHTIMYGYYYLMAMKMKPTWLPPQVITSMQILQMVFGVAVGIYFIQNLNNCAIKPELLTFCGIMYSSYLFLFAKFFVKRFILKPTPKKTITGEKNTLDKKTQ